VHGESGLKVRSQVRYRPLTRFWGLPNVNSSYRAVGAPKSCSLITPGSVMKLCGREGELKRIGPKHGHADPAQKEKKKTKEFALKTASGREKKKAH